MIYSYVAFGNWRDIRNSNHSFWIARGISTRGAYSCGEGFRKSSETLKNHEELGMMPPDPPKSVRASSPNQRFRKTPDIVMSSALRSFKLKLMEIGDFRRGVSLPRSMGC